MASESSPVCNFGWQARPFNLIGVDGRRYDLEAVRGSHGLLLMFICNHCPFVKAVLDKIVRDTRELKANGIGSVGIMSNDPADYPEDSFDNMRRIAEEKNFPFPYLLDDTQEVARAYGAVCTPDFFGFNDKLQLQYRGRLDDSGRETKPNARRELFTAMSQVAQTGKGPIEQTPSIGCSIKWRDAPS